MQKAAARPCKYCGNKEALFGMCFKCSRRDDLDRGEPNRLRVYKHRHGITKDQKYQILAQQGNLCACCRTAHFEHERLKRDLFWHVDRSPAGEVRSILCHRCHVSIRIIQDSFPHAQAIATYLQKWSK